MMAVDCNNKSNSTGSLTKATTNIHSTSKSYHPSCLNQPISMSTVNDWCPTKHQNQNDFHKITFPMYFIVVDSPKDTLKSILKTSTAYPSPLHFLIKQHYLQRYSNMKKISMQHKMQRDINIKK